MRHSLAWLGAAALVVLCVSGQPARAQGLKPYVVLVLDTSGSMDTSTGSGTPSCGGSDTRLNHAKCAINEIASSYGDMVFAFGRFRETVAGTYATSCDANGNLDGNPGVTFPVPSGGDQCGTQGVYCGNCNTGTGTPTTGFGSCTTADREFELLTPLIDGNNDLAANWTDFSCATCGVPPPGTAPTTSNEIWGVSPYTFTPLAAVLNGAKLYWRGQALASDGTTTIWPSGTAGFAPIANDPLNDEFLPDGCDPSPSCTSNCCATQCRPYITILLTDGAETCAQFSSTTAAASSMRTTDVGGNRYVVETKAIGFGITPGNTQIEGIAVAGSGTNTPGTCNSTDQTGCDGFYAQNQQELSLAISSILADTIRSETCNDADDDCDTIVDEDFPSLGTACDDGLIGICQGTGVFVCTGDETGTVCQIDNPGEPPGIEICNNLDDNCNGFIDEGLSCGGCGDAETCNNVDDDCDGTTDEDLVRPCGTDQGECTAGTEVCIAGDWENCTATGPFPEICDGLDNNCDGTCDGFSRPCTNLPGPGNPNIGPCHDGTQVCPAVCSGSGNTWGPCLDEVIPTGEICNCEDENCNGIDDDGTGGANCDTACGVGTTVCDQTACALVCDSTIVPGPEIICNGLDDDCDTFIDEDYVSIPCGAGPPPTVCDGMTMCVGGNEICIGDTIAPEQCDCDDNDCDGATDEMNGNCPAGSTCTSCQCAFPCGEGEFPCPSGELCDVGSPAPGDEFCIDDPCANVNCVPDANGNATVCIDGTCEVACDNLQQPCGPGTVCFGPSGMCVFDDCRSFPDRCTGAELCIVQDGAGVCVADPCNGVNCPTSQYCIGGMCTTSCGDVEPCPAGTVCQLGVCEPDACAATGPCLIGQICEIATGMCVTNPCNFTPCPMEGTVCDPQQGICIPDPCVGVTCPGNDICQLGTCYDPSHFQPDAEGPEQHVTTGGGGGCSTGGGGGAGAGLVLALLALATRRRRRGAGGRS
jgi:MYXO-CTERM domain-containing protein